MYIPVLLWGALYRPLGYLLPWPLGLREGLWVPLLGVGLLRTVYREHGVNLLLLVRGCHTDPLTQPFCLGGDTGAGKGRCGQWLGYG